VPWGNGAPVGPNIENAAIDFDSLISQRLYTIANLSLSNGWTYIMNKPGYFRIGPGFPELITLCFGFEFTVPLFFFEK
jgi:hypothetical protein